MKKILILLVIILLVVGGGIGALFAFKGTIAQNALASSFSSLTGLEVQVADVEVLDMGKTINVGSITFVNPEGFFSKNLALVTRVKMQCDPKAFLLNKKVACSHATAYLDKIFIDRTSDGKVNIREISAFKQDVLEAAAAEAVGSEFMLDRLELYYGSVKLTEASPKGNKSSEVEFDKQKEIYGFISDQSALLHIPAVKVLASINRGSLGIPRHMLQKQIMETTGRR